MKKMVRRLSDEPEPGIAQIESAEQLVVTVGPIPVSHPVHRLRAELVARPLRPHSCANALA